MGFWEQGLEFGDELSLYWLRLWFLWVSLGMCTGCTWVRDWVCKGSGCVLLRDWVCKGIGFYIGKGLGLHSLGIEFVGGLGLQ